MAVSRCHNRGSSDEGMSQYGEPYGTRVLVVDSMLIVGVNADVSWHDKARFNKLP